MVAPTTAIVEERSGRVIAAQGSHPQRAQARLCAGHRELVGALAVLFADDPNVALPRDR
jgi:hypothetical protein